MVELVSDDLWFCEDCAVWTETGDSTFMDCYYTEEESAAKIRDIEAGIRHLVAGRQRSLCMDGETLEFSRVECDCCGTSLAGARYRFALLDAGG